MATPDHNKPINEYEQFFIDILQYKEIGYYGIDIDHLMAEKSVTAKYHFDQFDIIPYSIREPKRLPFRKELKNIARNHNFHQYPLILKTCEGFLLEDTIEDIQIALGTEYAKRTILIHGTFVERDTFLINEQPVFNTASFSMQHLHRWLNRYFDQSINYDRKLHKTFSALYGRPSIDRISLYNHLYENYSHTSQLIFQNLNHENFVRRYEGYLTSDYQNTDYVTFDKSQTDRNIHNYVYEDLKERMNDVFVNVVSETLYEEENNVWFTEKTTIPILLGMPMMVSSTSGFYKMMKRFGFQTFSDYWSEDFDDVQDHFERLGKMNETLDYIANTYNTPKKRREALLDMKPILEHNRNLMIYYMRNREEFHKLIYINPDILNDAERYFYDLYPRLYRSKWNV